MAFSGNPTRPPTAACLFLAAFWTVLGGCASKERLARQWYGRHISDVVAYHGAPTKKVGNRYVFSRIEEHGSQSHYSTAGGYSPGTPYQPAQHTTVHTFWVDDEGYVYRVQLDP